MTNKMIVQVVDANGCAVARKYCKTVADMGKWLKEQYPELDRFGYKVEILYC